MRIRRPILPLVAASAVLLAACGDERQDVFTPEGGPAKDINNLQVPVFIIAGLVGVMVAVLLIVASIRGVRRRKADADDPVQIEGNFKLEIGWTIAPAALLAVIAVFTIGTLLQLDEAGAAPEDIEQMQVTVYGQQWWWAFEYDLDPAAEDGPEVITANDLVLPAGVDVKVDLTSRDVVHSFWVPALAGTLDAVPGRMHSLVLNAFEPGVYYGQCKEFCGLAHANMRHRVLAVPLDDFRAWLEQQQEQQPMLEEGDVGYEGQQLFISRCTACHQINGLRTEDGERIQVEGNSAVVSRHAPNLTHFATRGVYAGGSFELYDENGEVDRAQLEAWLRNPSSQKPMYVPEEGTPRGMPDLGLTEPEIDQLVEYLLTLHPDGVEGPPITTDARTDEQ
jgi:cytochrome c oxidase subunit 2